MNQADYVRNYQKSPRGKFVIQRANANRRGVDWELSFDKWWEIWEKSGKWEQRGRQAGGYVMARIKDTGAYVVGNVKIATTEKTSSESFANGLKWHIPKKRVYNRKWVPLKEEKPNIWPLNWKAPKITINIVDNHT